MKITDDLLQRCREMLELSERGESARPTLRALADTYHPDIPPHVRLSMAESQTHREAMRALLAMAQQPSGWNTPCASCATPRACQYDGCRNDAPPTQQPSGEGSISEYHRTLIERAEERLRGRSSEDAEAANGLLEVLTAHPVAQQPRAEVEADEFRALLQLETAIRHDREMFEGTSDEDNPMGSLVTAALSAIDAARRTTPDREAWQPIETAPRDGTQILGWCSNYGARQTHWHFYGEGSIAKAQFDAGKGESGNWYWEEPLNHWLSSWKPTHWMPLPTAPTSDKGGA